MTRPSVRARLRVGVLATVLAVTSFAVTATPSGAPADPGDDPLSAVAAALDSALRPLRALAGFCADEPAFTGRLTASATSTTAVSRITSPDVYGYISNVDDDWSCTAYYRFSALAWNLDATLGRFNWGALIHSTTVSCNWAIGSTDYLKANYTTDCPDTDAEYAMEITLTPQQVYQADVAHNSAGDLSWAHSDCGTYYGVSSGSDIGERHKTNESFATSNVDNRPGSNCDPIVLDNMGVSQTVTYDATVPAVSFDAPLGGPTTVTSATTTVQFDATDGLAGFGGANGWTLTRQVAPYDGTACGTFVNDTGAGAVTTGTTSALNQTVTQYLPSGSCYRWTLAATDQNGNTAGTVTSGSLYRNVDALLGLGGYQHFESFDLGAGDTLSVNAAIGNVVVSHPIVSLPIRGGTFDLGLTYNSADPANVGMGRGWQLNVQRRLTVDGSGNVTFTDADGARHTFTNPSGSGTVTYTRPDTLYANLVRNTGPTPDTFTLTYRDQSVDEFSELATNKGSLTKQRDRYGNAVTFAYAGTTLTTATDPAGRTVGFTWTSGKLTSITDWANVSTGVVQASGSGNRVHDFFYSGDYLAGWDRPLAPDEPACPSSSHRVCLTYTNGLLTAFGRHQTYTTLASGALSTGTRTATTAIAYRGGDIASVTDADGAATTFTRPAAGQLAVTRPGTPASVTTYGLVGAGDTLARVQSIWRTLGGSQIERRFAYSGSYPIEPFSVVDNYGALLSTPAREVLYAYTTYGLVARVTEPLDGTYTRWTDYTYNANNDVTQKIVSRQGDGTLRVTTRYCYTTTGCATNATDLLLRSTIENFTDGTAGGANGHVEDVTTAFQYDAYGQRTRETRSNYAAGSTLLDSRALAWTYDTYGNVTSEIANYANGTVAGSGDDVTPNGTTNARTDLTTVHASDTAGNRISTADPRRAILLAQGASLHADDYVTRSVYDAHNQATIEQLPRTPDAGDCDPAGASCRQVTRTYDEFGLVRLERDVTGRLTGTQYDPAGRAAETYQDDDGAGGANAVRTGTIEVDGAGRVFAREDWLQANDGGTSRGWTAYEYDALGRTTAVITAEGTAGESTTATTYDALDRTLTETVGTEAGTGSTGDAQTTTFTYDIGGRITQQNDEFDCVTHTYDYRDHVLTSVEGRTPGVTCSGSGTRTVTTAWDALGRKTQHAVTGGDLLEETEYDSAGRARMTWSQSGGVKRVTERVHNPLDAVVTEYRYTDTSGTKSAETWARANRDAAGNETDRCTWAATPSQWCLQADATFANPQPTSRSSSTYDARNQRTSLYVPGQGTTTYDPTAGYQVKSIHLPTMSGKEHETSFTYDARDRLDTITVRLCATSQQPCAGGNILSTLVVNDYAYDDNDNRTVVIENNGAGAVTRYYCYDLHNRLEKVSTSSSSCATVAETYEYDAAGNRTGVDTRDFTYNSEGQLESCTVTTCAPEFDAEGRLTKVTLTGPHTWSYLYDAEGRLTSACKATSCTGTGFVRLDSTYNAEGHRIRLVETPASGTATTTDFTYEGDKVVREVATTGAVVVTRTFTVDEAGTIRKMVYASVPADATNDGTYLVTYNGHGDAVLLSKVDTDGTLLAANRFTYTTWGTPTLSLVGSYGDLGFRYRYVGAHDVQWDGYEGAGLLYMHARHYHPEFGRFLQPDPSELEANHYAYAENNPVTKIDPTGTCAPCRLAEALRRAADAVSRSRIWEQLRGVLSTGRRPDLGRKLEFAFGRASGSGHNLERTKENLRLLTNIGIRDNVSGRKIVADALRQAFQYGDVIGRRPAGLVNGLGSVTRRSYVRGPHGYLIMESVWSGNKLVTVIFKVPTGWRVIQG